LDDLINPTVVSVLAPGPPGLTKRYPILSVVVFTGLDDLNMPRLNVSPAGSFQLTGTDKVPHSIDQVVTSGSHRLHVMLLVEFDADTGIEMTGAARSANQTRLTTTVRSGNIVIVMIR
jgi:hypothetical protein